MHSPNKTFEFSFENLKLVLFLLFLSSLTQSLLSPRFNVKTGSYVYNHFHFIDVFFKAYSEDSSLHAEIFRGDEKIKTVGGQSSVRLHKTEDSLQKGRFPVPWAAEDGLYRISLKDSKGDDMSFTNYFMIKTRPQDYHFDKKLKVLDLESSKNLKSYRIRTPAGDVKDYEAIFDWADFIGANTIWYMTGQTASYKKGDLTEAEPWIKNNIDSVKFFSKKAKENSFDFGAWICCYRTFGKALLKPDWYKYGYKYMRSRAVLEESGGISMSDPKRLDDIISLVKVLNDMESVDYIGLDYIRPAGGGLEMVDEFVEEMDVKVPEGWDKYSEEDRMKWIGELVTRQKHRDSPVIDMWNWWRAHRMSMIIRRIRESVELKKPLWTFVLSWELGHQHGQDPLMFQDAGSDLLSIMFYETDTARFEYMLKQWRKYLDKHKLNIAVGNQIDWVIHQYTVFPSGPEEYNRRLESSAEKINELDSLKGIFIHDFSRLISGRRGPYSSREWAYAASKAFNVLDESRLNIIWNIPEKVMNNESFPVSVRILNNSGKDISDASWKLSCLDEIVSGTVKKLENGEAYTIDSRFTLKAGVTDKRLSRFPVFLKFDSKEERFKEYSYIWVKDQKVDSGVSLR